LKADHDALRRLAHLHPKIEIEGVFGNPPERYRLKLKVKSLRERDGGEALETVAEHRLEVTMPKGYPRDAPLFRMLTPVFHPNIAPHAVCVGDDWTAGEPLDLLIQRVGEILAYQSYNIKSPLNGRAAQWVDEHQDRIPIDREEFFVDLSQMPASPAETAIPACSNCGARTTLTPCGKGHASCADCTVRCRTCNSAMCLVCGDKACATCAARVAAAAAVLCKNCGNHATGLVCSEWHTLCDDCGAACKRCGEIQCVVCASFPCRACGVS
jgi:hypothetical protein